MKKLLKAGLAIILVVGAPRIMGGGEKYPPGRKAQAFDEVRKILEREYDLKPRFVKGQKRHYRLWMTIDNLDAYGNVVGRNQWRGDFERVVVSLDSSGRAEEKVTWKNVGFRGWLMNESRYSPHQTMPWAEGFSYRFSLEDSYEDLNWDFSDIPKNMLGFVFRGALQISAHVEYDFLRSSRHAAIERLRRVGQLQRNPPEEGQVFSLDFPPVFTNSQLVRKHVQVGFLGLTLANGEPCALIDYQQGPQPFTWTMSMGAPGQPEQARMNTELISRQNGIFVVRLADGSLVHGEFTEITMSKMTPAAGGAPTSSYARGMWHLREITPEEFELGLTRWEEEQTPTPRFRPEVPPGKAVPGREQ